MSERLDLVVIAPGAAGLRRQKAWRGPDEYSRPGRRGIVCAQVHFVRLGDCNIREHGAPVPSLHMTALRVLVEQVGVRHRVIDAAPGGLTINDGQVVPSATELLIAM